MNEHHIHTIRRMKKHVEKLSDETNSIGHAVDLATDMDSLNAIEKMLEACPATASSLSEITRYKLGPVHRQFYEESWTDFDMVEDDEGEYVKLADVEAARALNSEAEAQASKAKEILFAGLQHCIPDEQKQKFLNDAYKALNGNGKALLLRKQAEAVEAISENLKERCKQDFRRWVKPAIKELDQHAQRLRQQADEIERKEGAQE